ncbi:MAG: hypothetical protein A2W79_14205 [Pseudomonadales bacterium RIFCSPLOWO2_12_60_38]|jgi:hypothetical protein|nr:hypothetical protein PD374_18595 [Pseudomonas sp. WCS374]AOS74834.1 hypothetical protein BH711_13125 [Pseudomonas fluorescens]EPJ85127.1 hypothetical protein CFT9_09205 [Pseudomonas sp. CFT9]KTC27029.1 hypothetical protein AO239_27390 [Pseudomonas sp. ICMP 19500]OHC30423.1 MAG: hypothetical protein A2W79_14205 [Pseudomonadales bacterium RIFCSPLOWO2_12_60_38]OHC37374.1 MAG: hypothetical protein A3G72_10840 [Pseudomonadales bacterium RIFCSPLOWO2_12_FULL_59_450]OJT29622.1 hypothetical protein
MMCPIAIPVQRVLQSEEIRLFHRSLLSLNVDIETGVEVVQRTDCDSGIAGCQIEHQHVDVGFVRVRMGVNDQNHGVVPTNLAFSKNGKAPCSLSMAALK